MYRIIKVLNNNGILVLDGDTGRELILLKRNRLRPPDRGAVGAGERGKAV
ncbi:MAG: CAT RNA binding domain-containing protein [Enterocloster bolteae]